MYAGILYSCIYLPSFNAKMVPVFAHENETAIIADGYPFSR